MPDAIRSWMNQTKIYVEDNAETYLVLRYSLFRGPDLLKTLPFKLAHNSQSVSSKDCNKQRRQHAYSEPNEDG